MKITLVLSNLMSIYFVYEFVAEPEKIVVDFSTKRFNRASTSANSAYDCFKKECFSNNTTEFLDIKSNLMATSNCSECMDQCDDDPKCEGVECDSLNCSLLKNGRCNKTELTSNPKSSRETCFKMIAFECKTTRLSKLRFIIPLFIEYFMVLYLSKY